MNKPCPFCGEKTTTIYVEPTGATCARCDNCSATASVLVWDRRADAIVELSSKGIAKVTPLKLKSFLLKNGWKVVEARDYLIRLLKEEQSRQLFIDIPTENDFSIDDDESIEFIDSAVNRICVFLNRTKFDIIQQIIEPCDVFKSRIISPDSELGYDEGLGKPCVVVKADFAEQIEAELAEARAEIERKDKLIEQMREALDATDEYYLDKSYAGEVRNTPIVVKVREAQAALSAAERASDE